MVPLPTPKVPVHVMSWAAVVMAVLAGVLALYGSMHAEKQLAGSPLREARGSAGLLPPRPADYQPLSEYADRYAEEEAEKTGQHGSLRKYWNWTDAALTWLYQNGRTETDRYILTQTAQSKSANYTVQFVAYVLPFLLGLAGVLTGGWAMKIVQASGEKYTGDMLAVFSMMIGGLASVVAFCMIVSLYVWPHMPALYTT